MGVVGFSESTLVINGAMGQKPRRRPEPKTFVDYCKKIDGAIARDDVRKADELVRRLTGQVITHLHPGDKITHSLHHRLRELLEKARQLILGTEHDEYDPLHLLGLRDGLQRLLELTNWRRPRDRSYRFALGLSASAEGYIAVHAIEQCGHIQVLDRPDAAHCTHKLLLPANHIFFEDEIRTFEQLINSDAPEGAFQEFFENNPKWLYLIGEQYEAYKSQVVLPALQPRPELALIAPESEKIELKPDFFLKRVGLDLWDVLDVKRPEERMLTGIPQRLKFTENVQTAIAQLRDYGQRLRQNDIKAKLAAEHNILVATPLQIVLIGRDTDLSNLHNKSSFREHAGIHVYTYDDLHRLAANRTCKQE